jgi:hypothetical protein
VGNEIVREIVDIVYSIYEMQFSEIDLGYYDNLRSLTDSIWETHHAELLQELKELDTESNVDFQLFWYDCLSFPRESPKAFYKNGTPVNILYGDLPSKIDRVTGEIGGYHDLNINYAEYENNTLSLYLDMRHWGIISKTDYQLKLTFKGVKNILFYKGVMSKKELEDFRVEKLMGNNILSGAEIPMIEYIFNSIELDKGWLIPEKRLLWLDIDIVREGFYELYFTFDEWEYKRFKD